MKPLDLRGIQTSGLNLIEASAGTGKTWTITALYILLLLKERMLPEEILVVTYTKAATAELRDRIRKRIVATLDLYSSGREPADELECLLAGASPLDPDTSQKLLTRALYSFDDASIFTIHGFCQRALLENAFESGSLFDTELTTDHSALVRQVCDDFWRTRIMPDEGPFAERLIADGYTPDKLAAPFEGHYQDPFLKIIPVTEDPDLTALSKQLGELLPALAAMWQLEREAIIRHLLDANLSLTSHKPERIQTAAMKLDACLAAGSVWNIADCLALFTTSRITAAMKKGSSMPDHPFFSLCQELSDACIRVNDGYRDKLINCRTALLEMLRTELPKRKQALNLRGYDDLLLDLHLALEGPGGERLAIGLRERFHAALIDEFQDTDPLQWRIFARIAGGDTKGASYPLFLIGDPKQAIYSFRGADIHSYIKAVLATETEKRWTLDTNRRSAPALVTAVNTIFNAVDDPFLCSDIRFSKVHYSREQKHQLLHNGAPLESPLRFWVYLREDQTKTDTKGPARAAIVTTTAAGIARLLDGGYEIISRDGARRPLKPGDIAVLVKAHYQADQMQAALSALGIPSVQHGSATIFETGEARALLCILRAVADPSRSALIREALLTPVIGLSANEVFSLLEDEDAWEIWLMRFRAMREAAMTGGVIALASRLLGECGVRKRTLALDGGERRMTNLLHCFELLHQAEREQSSGLEGLITWLERRITGEQQDETYLLRLETDANAVTLATIHASKGLEYPVVFLPFAWDSSSTREKRVLFHDDDGALTLDLGSEKREKEHKRKSKEELDAEAARLLYVALTRAELLCYVAWGAINGAYESPLCKLIHNSGYKDAKAFGAANDQEILNAVLALAEKAGRGETPPISARFLPVDEPAPHYRSDQEGASPYTCRELNKVIPGDWRVSSFSSIISGVERHAKPHDYDAAPSSVGPAVSTAWPSGGDVLSSEPKTGISIFDFPRGTAAGTCLHELFEKLDFTGVTDDSLKALNLACLQRNGYDRRWLPALQRMALDVISAPIIPDDPGFSLRRLKPGSWLTEMEFFLPVERLGATRLRELFAGLLDQNLSNDFDEILASFQAQETRGMLQGFIDIVFEHNGRYYIIDWKSNHLGDRQDDYCPEALNRSMIGHAYILQYHLYTLALDRILRLRLPEYKYETHFGGAIYLFLRGVTAGRSDRGIFYDRPEPEFIQRANRIILADAEPISFE